MAPVVGVVVEEVIAHKLQNEQRSIVVVVLGSVVTDPLFVPFLGYIHAVPSLDGRDLVASFY
jgi:hypothetical protein